MRTSTKRSDAGIRDALEVLGGIGLGTALMYFADPDHGDVRRERVRQGVAHGRSKMRAGLRSGADRALVRARGGEVTVPDEKVNAEFDAYLDARLEDRVREALEEILSFPNAVDVRVSGGVVRLRGPVLAHELDAVLDEVENLHEVVEVKDALEVHDTADEVPDLRASRGGSRRRSRLGAVGESPLTRVVAVAAGSAMTYWGRRRRDRLGTVVGMTGLGLLAASTAGLVFGAPGRQLAARVRALLRRSER